MKTLYLLFFACILFPHCSKSQTITTFAGNGIPTYSGDGGAATAASLSRPISCVMDNAGNLLISDFNNSRIRQVTPAGVITTIAGTGTPGFSGDGGLATAAEIRNPEKITVDVAGNIYFCDFNNQRVRKINTAGIISTIAGTGATGYTGDGGPATMATFWNPGGIAIDAAGNIYITDEWNNRIRKINTSGIISTIAGDGSTGYMAGGYGGDGGAAIAAHINFPVGIAISSSGNIIFSDDGNDRVREISAATGIITTIAGNGTGGSTGDGGAATLAELDAPEGVAVDPAGNVYICETTGNRVRKVNASGTISTLAGTGTAGFSGDGAAATLAELDYPEGVFVDTITNCVYICDADNNRVRSICESFATTCNSISLPDTLNLCLTDTITLPVIINGADSILSIAWTPSTGLSSTTIADPLLTTSTPGWYYITVNNLMPDNLVVNGNFSAGNAGFSTGYTVEGYGSTSTPGYYAVDTNPYLYDAAWPVMGDHTTGTGNMLIVDGSYTSGESFWCETIPVLANTNYVFTVWTALLHDPVPSLQITINGVNVSTFSTSSTSTLWQQQQVNWNSGTATSANICMSDLATGGYGNDFAIDDISFQQICVAKDSVYITICAPVACNSISMPDTLHVCFGDTATIPATIAGSDSILSINWSPASGLSDTIILNPVLTAGAPGWYYLTVQSLLPDNLVNNGNFSMGNVGFTSPSYTFLSTIPVSNEYTLSTDISLADPGFPIHFYDHTNPPTGLMLAVNGGSPASNTIAWQETVPVTAGDKYDFSAWYAYWTYDPSGASNPNLYVTITPVGGSSAATSDTFNALTSACTWNKASYVWNAPTGATNAIIQVIDQNSAYYYNDFCLDDISFEPICVTTDSIYVSINLPDSAFTHTDTSVCSLTGTVILYAPAGYTSPIWNTGATTNSITANDSGTYWVKGTSSCTLQVDTFHITNTTPNTISQQTDSTICAGNSLTLNAPVGYSGYTWNTGGTDAAIVVNNAGAYWVTSTSLATCTINTDTFNVTITPLPIVLLGNDTVICQGVSVTLVSQGTTGTYSWNTGSTDQSITVSTAGTFVLTVTNNGCSASDSVQISELAAPVMINLGPDTILCTGDLYVLSTGTDSVLWSTGVVATSITVTEAGTYWASAGNACGSFADSVNISFEFCNLIFPNAFTPNNDGKNDIAKAIGSLALYHDYSLSIYNRFGQRVFYTEDIYDGWNGIYNGAKADVGTYFYAMTFTLEGKSHMMKGDLTLIR